eukprot:1185614-Prorocentrum_minimum.AAC.5
MRHATCDLRDGIYESTVDSRVAAGSRSLSYGNSAHSRCSPRLRGHPGGGSAGLLVSGCRQQPCRPLQLPSKVSSHLRSLESLFRMLDNTAHNWYRITPSQYVPAPKGVFTYAFPSLDQSKFRTLGFVNVARAQHGVDNLGMREPTVLAIVAS